MATTKSRHEFQMAQERARRRATRTMSMDETMAAVSSARRQDQAQRHQNEGMNLMVVETSMPDSLNSHVCFQSPTLPWEKRPWGHDQGEEKDDPMNAQDIQATSTAQKRQAIGSTASFHERQEQKRLAEDFERMSLSSFSSASQASQYSLQHLIAKQDGLPSPQPPPCLQGQMDPSHALSPAALSRGESLDSYETASFSASDAPVGVFAAVSSLEYDAIVLVPSPTSVPPTPFLPCPRMTESRLFVRRHEECIGTGQNAKVYFVPQRSPAYRFLEKYNAALFHIPEKSYRAALFHRRWKARRERLREKQGAASPNSPPPKPRPHFVWKVVGWDVSVNPRWPSLKYQWRQIYKNNVIECSPFLCEALVHLLVMQHVYPVCPHFLPLHMILVQHCHSFGGMVVERLHGTLDTLDYRLTRMQWDVVLFMVPLAMTLGASRIRLKHHDLHPGNIGLGDPPPQVPASTKYLLYCLYHPKTKQPTWFRVPMTSFWVYIFDFGFSSADDPVTNYRVGRGNLRPQNAPPPPSRYASYHAQDPCGTARPRFVWDGKTERQITREDWGPLDYDFESSRGYDLQHFAQTLDILKTSQAREKLKVSITRLKQLHAAACPKGTRTTIITRPAWGGVSQVSPREVLFRVFHDWILPHGPSLAVLQGKDPSYYIVTNEAA